MLNYKGLKATLERLIISDTQVDRQIERILEQNCKIIPVSGRPAQIDDEVVLDYAGFCDGTQFEGGTAERQTLTLGSGMFIPGFEEQLIGKNIGDDIEVNVTFPVPYHSEALAGKNAIFKCKIHEIRVKEKYALNDEFAKEVGGCDTLADFREALREGMQGYADRQADMEMKDQLMDQIIKDFDCEITDEQLTKAVDMEMKTLEAQLGRQGLNLDMYCQFASTTREELREDCIPTAQKNILRQNVIAQIAEIEGIEADEASVAEEFSRICTENGITVEQLQPYLDEQMQADIIRSVITNKVLDKICEYADINTSETKN